ncbi:MAG: hypothetical protein J7641_22180 [Cyanobacteria bacterium SID2]|nr:hypothetical protein [Cyanobacteria bacterium SID2]MBP0004510.1 hypothetical protein [Cyanobacteria bacterium SBC]
MLFEIVSISWLLASEISIDPILVERSISTFDNCSNDLFKLSQSIDSFENIVYDTYYNRRFNFSVDYPSGLLLAQGESINGDGQSFLAPDRSIAMVVFGQHNRDNLNIEALYQNALINFNNPEHSKIITYQIQHDNWFVISGYSNDLVFYQRTILEGNIIQTLTIEYNAALQPEFDDIVTEISRSFRSTNPR